MPWQPMHCAWKFSTVRYGRSEDAVALSRAAAPCIASANAAPSIACKTQWAMRGSVLIRRVRNSSRKPLLECNFARGETRNAVQGLAELRLDRRSHARGERGDHARAPAPREGRARHR